MHGRERSSRMSRRFDLLLSLLIRERIMKSQSRNRRMRQLQVLLEL